MANSGILLDPGYCLTRENAITNGIPVPFLSCSPWAKGFFSLERFVLAEWLLDFPRQLDGYDREPVSQVAAEAECSQGADIRKSLPQFGNVHAPPTRKGRKRTVTPLMIQALCDRLSEKPGLYLDEMAVLLIDEF